MTFDDDSPRLMIVEDNEAQLEALCTALTAEGFVVKGFNSPRHALEALKSGTFDLVLTDLKMPEMDGISLITAARQVDMSLAAIVMTGYGTVETAARAMKGGAFDYVLKPIKLRVMLPLIRRALDLKRLHHENGILARALATIYQELQGGFKASLRSIEDVARMLEEESPDELDGRRLARVLRGSVNDLERLTAALLEHKRQFRKAI